MFGRKLTWLYAAIVGVFLVAAGTGVYYYQHYQQGPIYEYIYDRDAADIKDLMTLDWYWLISSPDYQVDFMLKNRAPNHKDPRYFGKMNIKVLRINDAFAGFVTYYKKSAYEGSVLFLAVRPEFRGKRYAQMLLDYAVEQLKQQGALYVRLVTRTNNLKAQAVYKRDGFDELGRDDEFVYYQKALN